MIVLRRNFGKYGIEITPPETDEKELICWDLHIGGVFRQPGDPHPYELSRPYELRPAECIVVRTKQEFEIGDGVFGLLCSKGSLTAQGLVVANTKIDPLFGGPLDVSIYNAGQRTIKIEREMPFCSVVFYVLEEGTGSKRRRRSPDLSGDSVSRFRRFWDRWGVTVIMVLGSTIGAALATYVTIIANK